MHFFLNFLEHYELAASSPKCPLECAFIEWNRRFARFCWREHLIVHVICPGHQISGSCVIVYQYYRDPLCGEQWGQRSRCENAPIYGGQRRRRGQKLACLVPLPSLGSRCTQTHSPCTQSLSRWVRIIQETQKSFLLDGKSSCSVWHTPAWIIYCLIFKKRYPCFRIALVQMSYLLLILQDLF